MYSCAEPLTMKGEGESMSNAKCQMTNEIQMSNVQLTDRKTGYTKKYDIYERVFQFTVKTVRLLEKLPRTTMSTEYGRQLIRSSGSIGANLEEADGALTKKDFINRVGISRREARESRHWLKLMQAVVPIQDKSSKEELGWLIDEANEILLILSSIIKNSQRNRL